jgi:hypothetical protein
MIWKGRDGCALPRTAGRFDPDEIEGERRRSDGIRQA